MKKLFTFLFVALLSGCAHREFVCGNMFSYVESEAKEFSANFRDDRLLKTDFVVFGTVQEWTPTWKAEPRFAVAAKIRSEVKVYDVELSVEQGFGGKTPYSRVVIFSAAEFSGEATLFPMEFTGTKPDARWILSFRAGNENLCREVEIAGIVQPSSVRTAGGRAPSDSAAPPGNTKR